VKKDENPNTNSNESVSIKHVRAEGFRFHPCTGVIAVPVPRERIQLNFYSEYAHISGEAVSIASDGNMTSNGVSTELVREHIVGLDLPVRVAHEMYQMLYRIFDPSGKAGDSPSPQ
jgi:hypothetical protein